jgi:DNA primase
MIPKEKIFSAKQADLPSILQSMGVDLIAEGNSYHLREHDSLKLFRRDGIWLYKWWSRGGEVGDGIQYLQRHFDMSFSEAVETLSGNTTVQSDRHDIFDHKASQRLQLQWMSINWQAKSEKLILVSQSCLFGPNGKERISYLVNERGLHLDTIQSHRLGWLPAKDHMPSKILIPCYDSQGRLIRIRFRIDNPKPGQERYRISKGSNSYSPFPLGISNGKPVVLVESELDAILVAQEAGSRVGVLGIGTTGAKFISTMVKYLNEKVPLILISLDNDQGGRDKTASLINELHNAINWCVPEKYGKDPGEAWKRMSIDKWVEAGLKGCLFRI